MRNLGKMTLEEVRAAAGQLSEEEQELLYLDLSMKMKEEDPEQVLQEFRKGDQVEIFRGSLQGLLGQLVDVKGKQKVRIEIESIGQSIILTIPKSYLKIVGK